MMTAAAVGGKQQEHLPGQKTCLTQSEDSDDERLQKLQHWAAKHNIWIHEDVLVGLMHKDDDDQSPSKRVEQHPKTRVPSPEDDLGSGQLAKGEGYGMYVKQGKGVLEERQVLVLVPKAAILSPRTSSLASHLDANTLFDQNAASGMLLALVLLHEFLVGERGPWWGYLQSMPRQRYVGDDARWGVSLPMHWRHESEEWLWTGKTEAGRIVKRTSDDPLGRIEGIGMSLARLRTYFRSTALPILRRAHPELFKTTSELESIMWEDFVGIQSIISSRAFVVDMYHGQALVPVSDMFNHSDDANVHFEADDEVCDECGSLGSCAHNDDPLPSAAYGRPSAFMPAASGPNSVGWKPPAALEGVDTVDMVAQERIAAGNEAFNTYGLMSNAVLLTAYGFALDEETEWERCAWEWRNEAERAEVRAALGMRATSKRKMGDNIVDGHHHIEEPGHSLYDDWTKACIAFSRLLPSAFDELRQNPIDVLGRHTSLTAASGEMPSLSMPIASPFVALTRSIDESDGMEETALSECMQDVFTSLSMHDGSRDVHQPLFIDSIGRVSWALWRAALLAALVCRNGGATGSEKDIVRTVGAAEELLERVIRLSESGEAQVKIAGSTVGAVNLLLTAVQSVRRLVSCRLDEQHISQPEGQTNALRILETAAPGPLRSAVLHAFQEASALRACVERFQTYEETLAKHQERPSV